MNSKGIKNAQYSDFLDDDFVEEMKGDQSVINQIH